jgi:hypothetical protein
MRTALAFIVLMSYVATKAAQEFRDDVLSACRHFGLNDEQIAQLLGISRGQFADQKALNQHLSAYRVADLPLAIRTRLLTLQGDRLNCTVLPNGLLAEFLAGALHRRRTRQLKMALADERTERLA